MIVPLPTKKGKKEHKEQKQLQQFHFLFTIHNYSLFIIQGISIISLVDRAFPSEYLSINKGGTDSVTNLTNV